MPGFIGGLGAPELLIILAIVVLIFGVGKLPQIGGAVGKGIREFKDNVTDRSSKSDAPSGELKS